MQKYKIARLVLTEPIENPISILDAVADSVNYKADFLITPGGFLADCFDLGEEIQLLSVQDFENNQEVYNYQMEYLKDLIETNFHKFKSIQKLRRFVKYLSLGFDLYLSDVYENDECNEFFRYELVILYSFEEGRIVNITGKFYPTSYEVNEVIKVTDLDTKFLQIGEDKVLILGCHDLNVFNPRGQANLKEGSYKSIISSKFKKRFEEEKPNIILQHPHTTDTYKIWYPAWNTIQKKYDFVEHFASGILYYNPEGEPRSSLEQVIEKTKKGSVIDIII